MNKTWSSRAHLHHRPLTHVKSRESTQWKYRLVRNAIEGGTVCAWEAQQLFGNKIMVQNGPIDIFKRSRRMAPWDTSSLSSTITLVTQSTTVRMYHTATKRRHPFHELSPVVAHVSIRRKDDAVVSRQPPAVAQSSEQKWNANETTVTWMNFRPKSIVSTYQSRMGWQKTQANLASLGKLTPFPVQLILTQWS